MKKSFLLFLMLLIHCKTSYESIHFIPKPKEIESLTTNSNLIKKKEIIAIIPFEDSRIGKDSPGYWVFLPFYFWETNEYNSQWKTGNFQIKKDYAYAIQDEFNSYPFFSDVYITENNDLKDANYLVKGKIVPLTIELL